MIANVAGVILCILFSLAGMVLGIRQRKMEWFAFSILLSMVAGGIVLFLLFTVK